jgi:hypothetical protein
MVPSRSSSSSKTKYYSPEVLRRNMDDHGIEFMDPGHTEEIQVFFEELNSIKKLVKHRDKSFDDGPLLFKGVLEDWVIEYAIGPIPSRGEILHLDSKVSLHSIPLLFLLLNNSSF